MTMPEITLISFGYFEKDLLESVAEVVKLEFRTSAMVREGHIDLSDYYDPGRRQYNGNTLLKHVDSLILPVTGKMLGLFNVDLFIPILTYIFGQAFLGGRTGIASLYRLNNECYGLSPDHHLMVERFKKEVIHELGHMFGLIHCRMQSCVMKSSTYVEDIDQKNHSLCPECRKWLGENTVEF